MAQPFGVGDVVGGRYRITHHVVTSADQDIIFQATDEVLDREVSVLLASRANAKQVATSAKELATGERSSEVQVLDLGLSEERTYLISSVVDPNQLLDLVVPDTAPYVEPYFTDSLGSELFGQSREMQPQTHHDDAEYYAALQQDLEDTQGDALSGAARYLRRRPAFLDKVTPQHRRGEEEASASAEELPASSRPSAPRPRAPRPASGMTQKQHKDLQSVLNDAGQAHGIQPSTELPRISFSLRSDLELVNADPSADAGESFEATAPLDGFAGTSGTHHEQVPSSSISTVPVSSPASNPSSSQAGAHVDELEAEGEEVIDNPPQEPDAAYDRRRSGQMSDSSAPTQGRTTLPRPAGEDSGSGSQFGGSNYPDTFTGLMSTVPKAGQPATEARDLTSSSDHRGHAGHGRTTMTWWILAALLGVLVLVAAIVLFVNLG